MKVLTLAATLGLTLLANTAVAAVTAQDSSVWRQAQPAAETAETAQADTEKSNEWRQTQFSPVEATNKEEKAAIWRTIKH